jgi:pyruvate/2-oxoacid:ferredoxin oxidoreductase beta subunit
MALAVALDASFAARGFSGSGDHLKGLMKAAIGHEGFALLDILQPCVTFNKVNTFAWYKERVYHLEEGYDPGDRLAAFERSPGPAPPWRHISRSSGTPPSSGSGSTRRGEENSSRPSTRRGPSPG